MTIEFGILGLAAAEERRRAVLALEPSDRIRRSPSQTP
jgi:hypothetical protein